MKKHEIYHTSGYRLIYSPAHSRANTQGYVPEHVLVCEKALGKPLPEGAEPHHVDGIKSNNTNSNLVLCQDHDYHSLIERRTRAYKACGYANWRKCPYCKKWDDPANMHVYEKIDPNRSREIARNAYHVSCNRDYQRTKRALKKPENKSCACGCGRLINPLRKHKKFASTKCANRFHNSKRRNSHAVCTQETLLN